MTEEIQQQVRQVKQSFRLMMDGAVAQSMREKGVDYRLNWGVTLPRLRELAAELAGTCPSPYDLAIALWKENVRECKILATMLMPPGEILPEVVDIWMEQTETVEIAEQAAMNLYQHLPFAMDKAFQWIASDRELCQLCGFHVLSRLFMQRREPDERRINEYLDQVHVALLSPSLTVRKAALNSLNRFAALGLLYQRLADSILRMV